MLMMMALAAAANPKASCEGGAKATLVPVVIEGDRPRSYGTIAKSAMAADLGDGLLIELRYEHAYAATFVVLELRKDGETVGQAMSWNPGVVFDLDTPRKPEQGPMLGSLSLQSRVDGKLVKCTAISP